MPRKPAQLEQKGGKSPRQHIWEAIRTHRKEFTRELLADYCNGKEGMISCYVAALLKAEIIEVIAEEKVNAGGCRPRLTYRLVRDNGVEAPRVSKTGEIVSMGGGNEAMWRTMHRMFERTPFSFRELVAFASTSSHPIKVETAKAYISALYRAGYLKLVEKEKRGKAPSGAKYVLIAARYTGPRAPMVQRTRTVYDPNENRVVHVDTEAFTNAL
ncbi:hypothetical protein HF908_08675 [Ralstonia pseudosolanacearum]|uniref:hypothetical protein n=1 Tax=Ralstonia pseudosolanacearum TaxID=1310165 RepID=UPI001868659D|nr:hypothetical protein [Ralstonia pseudosolanacearum]QOK91543.1 hypothetical protein HF908_08675 [Ralstonia pseudosolanacearum]